MLKLRNTHVMSFIFLSLGPMSHVDFMKWPCYHMHVKVWGQVINNGLKETNTVFQFYRPFLLIYNIINGQYGAVSTQPV